MKRLAFAKLVMRMAAVSYSKRLLGRPWARQPSSNASVAGLCATKLAAGLGPRLQARNHRSQSITTHFFLH